ncbi:MAG: BadF/BadG/BcrA/BcrD ATPase family protein [Melioribacteraceae bacterium]|nr:hypothetical protein [Melioribacteraceae bacterium]WKZ69184.1 MAG: BadF/BadG/BcrA/BcrD ATPase family protein [Melioribacteraceae bacterium]
MKRILCGIDGGGSNTKLLITDENLNVLTEDVGGASNFLKIGFEEAVLNVINLLDPHLNNYKDHEIALVIGTAGAGRKDSAEKFQDYLSESLPKTQHIKVVSDAEITIKGAFENEDGAILIAGTGSILFYKIENIINRVGGFGRLIGDEGSGYSIGQKGLNLFSKMVDGRINKSELFLIAKTELKVNSTNELIDLIYKNNYEISQFAEVVINAASKGIQDAINILQSEANELLIHLKAMCDSVKFDRLNLILTGGLLQSENYYKKMLTDIINKKLPQLKIIEPKHSAEFGAVLIAKNLFKGIE